jgi:hypothetical protein
MEQRICVNCGEPVPADFERMCNTCWKPWDVIDPVAMAASPRMRAVTELERATQKWTLPLVPRIYQDKEPDRQRLTLESRLMAEHGYEPSMQTQDGGHVHVGRLLMTGGWSVLAGQRGIRSKGGMTITYTRKAEVQPSTAPSVDPLDQLKKLGELRDAGVLTTEEFEAKKAQILERM